MRRPIQILVAGFILLVVIIGVVIWNPPGIGPCQGISSQDIALISEPGVSVLVKKGETIELLTHRERLELAKVIERNASGWSFAWPSESLTPKSLQFKEGGDVSLELAVGEKHIAQSFCQKSLDIRDQERMLAIVEHFIDQ